MSEAERFAAVLRKESLRRVDDRYVHHAIIRNQMREMADTIDRWERMEFTASASTPCPRCGGAGIVDTSPPGVEHTAPWLQTDIDCPRCDGTGEIDPTTYEPDIEES